MNKEQLEIKMFENARRTPFLQNKEMVVRNDDKIKHIKRQREADEKERKSVDNSDQRGQETR